MRFNKLDLNLLVALDALLTERNITRAAERVHLSQPAMSNALARLREYFDDELLVQVSRKLELTPRAQTLHEAVRDVLLRIDTSIAAPPQFDCTRSDREFTILLSDYSIDLLMPHALAIAAQHRSSVRFRLLPQVATPARALERGEADLLIIPKDYCSADHPTEFLFDENYVCAVWSESSHVRAGLNYERYASAGHVVVRPIESTLTVFESSVVQSFGLVRRVEVTCYSFAAIPFLVTGTERIATVHTRLARRLLPALPIALLPVPLPMPSLTQVMQWHKYRTLDPGLAWLRTLIKQAAAAMAADPAFQTSSGQP